MPNASTTQASSASSTTGSPIPIAYGYQWATGKRVAYVMLQDTGSIHLDYTRAGIWLLGHGEWDGNVEEWINDSLVWEGETADPTQFHFHRGADAVIGSGLTPSSSGPDQAVDSFWSSFPPAINRLAYSRIAYYAIKRKQPANPQTNTHQDDPTQWVDINPIGLWRALRCRLFDDQGNMTGYAFTTNPAWHFVDLLLRRKLFADYALDLNAGPDDLTTAIRNRFDWGTIYASAQYFDEILANGRRRFQGSYAFTQQTTLQACLEQILLVCRSYMTEYAGKIAIKCDMPRSSVFSFTRDHILPGSWEASDSTAHNAANRYIANFRDVLVPAAAAIASITCADHKEPIVTTEEPHPFENGDRIAIGGTSTVYDGNWKIDQVPAGDSPTTFSMISKGSNYPASVGAGGSVGLRYSRFKERAPEFWHKQDMMARGALGVGIARRRNKVKQALDFATSTWDQCARIAAYERDRALGIDQTPYVLPKNVKLSTSLFARDASGNLAAAVQPGDHVTLDETTNFQYAGEYEVLDPLTVRPPRCANASNGSMERAPAQDSGQIDFVLGPYDESIMYDASDAAQAGWDDVPGSDPGNDSSYTGVPLANGGKFVFFTGALASGLTFELPSTGFPVGNVMAWAGPQGYKEYGHPMHVIQRCDAALPSRQLTLTYIDGGDNTWPGDVNYAALSWLSSDVTFRSGGVTWIEFTLLGGETILFGQGIVADGTTIVLPAGYTTDKMFATAFPHDGTPTDNDAHGVACFVDSSQVAHLNYQDGESHVWHGNASVLVFAWKNNGGTVVTEALTGANWMHIPLSDGSVFGVGCGLAMSNGATFPLPASAGDGSTLEAIAGPSGFEIVDHPAHGVGACYLDQNNVVNIMFEDGEGNVWYGTADVFALFAGSGSAPPTLVTVTPATANIPAGSSQQFAATVSNNANTSVTWNVDGIIGGNLTVGLIDASGNYSAPDESGTHTITATSVADATASGSAKVTVFYTLTLGSDILMTAAGDLITLTNGDTIEVDRES